MSNKLLIISHTNHYIINGAIYGWSPTVKENDFISKNFTDVSIIGELHQGKTPPNFNKYSNPNINFISIKPKGGVSVWNKIEVLFQTINYWRIIKKSISRLSNEDWIYVRCPCSVSLVACIYLIFSRHSKRWFKYGGNWDPDSSQPLSYKIQRWILEKNLCKGRVTISGSWNNQKNHLKSFLNPCMTLDERNKSEQKTKLKKILSPFKFVFVGRVEEKKGIFDVLKIAEELSYNRYDFHIDVIGTGRDIKSVETFIEKKELTHRVTLRGELSKTELSKFYETAHLLLLPSRSEGWPKVISEAMAHKCVPIASAVGSIPQYLSEFNCGICLQGFHISNWFDQIQGLLGDKDKWEELANNALDCSIHFTYEKMIEDLQSRIFLNQKFNPLI